MLFLAIIQIPFTDFRTLPHNLKNSVLIFAQFHANRLLKSKIYIFAHLQFGPNFLANI